MRQMILTDAFEMEWRTLEGHLMCYTVNQMSYINQVRQPESSLEMCTYDNEPIKS